MRALGQGGQPALFIAPHPSIDGLAAHRIGDRRLADGQAISDDGQDCVMRCSTLLSSASTRPTSLPLGAAQTGGGRVSRISRYYVTDHPLLANRSAVTDPGQISRGNNRFGGGGRTRTADFYVGTSPHAESHDTADKAHSAKAQIEEQGFVVRLMTTGAMICR